MVDKLASCETLYDLRPFVKMAIFNVAALEEVDLSTLTFSRIEAL